MKRVLVQTLQSLIQPCSEFGSLQIEFKRGNKRKNLKQFGRVWHDIRAHAGIYIAPHTERGGRRGCGGEGHACSGFGGGVRNSALGQLLESTIYDASTFYFGNYSGAGLTYPRRCAAASARAHLSPLHHHPNFCRKETESVRKFYSSDGWTF